MASSQLYSLQYTSAFRMYNNYLKYEKETPLYANFYV